MERTYSLIDLANAGAQRLLLCDGQGYGAGPARQAA
jgi:hypothetical protein